VEEIQAESSEKLEKALDGVEENVDAQVNPLSSSSVLARSFLLQKIIELPALKSHTGAAMVKTMFTAVFPKENASIVVLCSEIMERTCM